jgi:hypothetical protein
MTPKVIGRVIAALAAGGVLLFGFVTVTMLARGEPASSWRPLLVTTVGCVVVFSLRLRDFKSLRWKPREDVSMGQKFRKTPNINNQTQRCLKCGAIFPASERDCPSCVIHSPT